MLLLVVSLLLLFNSAWQARKEFQSYFNPWFFFFSTEVLLVHLLSIYCANDLDLIEGGAHFDNLMLCSSLYIGGYAMAYFIRPRVLRDAVGTAMQLVPEVGRTTKVGLLSYMFVGLAFLLLVSLGAAGTLWFTDPRDAYLNFRGATGDGALFVLAQWALMLSAIVNLSVMRNRKGPFLGTLLLHCALAYFLGSKQILLNLLVFALFIIDAQYKVVRLRHFLGLGALAVLMFLALLGGTEDSTPLAFAKLYFSEYSANTSNIFDPAVTAAFAPGQILISNVWTFVPRFLVDNKPFEYGVVLINSVLFPGAAERGQTPGLLNWSSWYVDFGFLGVLFFGLLRGTLDGALYRTACSLGDSPIKVALLFGASVTPIFLYAPLAYQFVFVLVVSFVLRSIAGRKWRARRRKLMSSQCHQLPDTK